MQGQYPLAGYRNVSSEELQVFNAEYGALLSNLNDYDLEAIRLHCEDEGIDNPEVMNAFTTPLGVQSALVMRPRKGVGRYFFVFYVFDTGSLVLVYNEDMREEVADDNFIIHLFVTIMREELPKLSKPQAEP